MKIIGIIVLSLLLVLTLNVSAQITQEEYIDLYREMAIKEMVRSGVPASITLAQGILESGNGNSYLAINGNNHFGIKCGGNWLGEYLNWDDDKRQECFRKYNSVEDSFADHSDFLLKNSRYGSLFNLEITDYKGWCHGLKNSGYATSPTYAEKLISLIERHSLHIYDTQGNNLLTNSDGKINYTTKKNPENKREDARQTNNNTLQKGSSYISYNKTIYTNNNIPYIVADKDIDIKTLAKEVDLMSWQITKYNDLSKNEIINKGDIVYIKPKRNKAEKQYNTHIVKEGETMRDIAQKYGIKLNKLYKKNVIKFDTEVGVGTELNLRKNKQSVFKK